MATVYLADDLKHALCPLWSPKASAEGGSKDEEPLYGCTTLNGDGMATGSAGSALGQPPEYPIGHQSVQ